ARHGVGGTVPRCRPAAAVRRDRAVFLQLHHALRSDSLTVRWLTAAAASWLAGCTVVPDDAVVPSGDATIYVVARGWHPDIGLAVDDVQSPLASLAAAFPGVRFMVFGFGERQYYMAHDAGSGEILSALLPSDSAILLTALRTSPPEAFPDHDVLAL